MWFDQLDSNSNRFSFDLPLTRGRIKAVNASGSLGFFPDPKIRHLWGTLSAFITNPISYLPRKSAQNRICIPFTRRVHSNGGFLLHTGHPNPGFNRVIKKYSSLWASSDLPIIVHLMAEDKESLSVMINRLESCENVLAIELGFSPQMDISAIGLLVQAAQGELPLILNLSLDQSLKFAGEVQTLPISMLRLSGPDGLLPDEEGNLQSGRLYGPAILPLALAEVKRLHAFSKSAQQELRIIGGGGIYSKNDISAMLLAGAEAIAFDTLLWHPATDLSVILGD